MALDGALHGATTRTPIEVPLTSVVARILIRTYHPVMKTLKARVLNGHLVLDEPSEFPEGTEVELAIADSEDDLDPVELAALHEALRESWASARRGETRPVEELLARLRNQGG